ncbi:MAG TPA: single-stranded DNA-binding protein [Cytophagaceae bacterium]
MNKVIMLGRLSSDTELRTTQSGTAVCKFSIAVDRPAKQGEERQADFFRIAAWGKTGEFVNTYFEKGQRILIEGRLQNNNYEDKNGIKHYSNDVIAEKVYFADGKRTQQAQQETPQENFEFNPEESDDLPF